MSESQNKAREHIAVLHNKPQKKKILASIFLCTVFLCSIGVYFILSTVYSKNSGYKGYVYVTMGFPPTVQLIGYVKADGSPLYQVTLPGVIQTNEGIIIIDVLPKQEATTLPIIPNKNGVITYDDCLTLFEHLDPVYGFRYVQYNQTAAKQLQEEEIIHVKDFYPMLKMGKVPPLSPKMVVKMKEALEEEKQRGKQLLQ